MSNDKYASGNAALTAARQYARQIADAHALDLDADTEDAIVSTIANILSNAARVQREQEQEIARLRHDLMRAEDNARMLTSVVEFWKKNAGG